MRRRNVKGGGTRLGSERRGGVGRGRDQQLQNGDVAALRCDVDGQLAPIAYAQRLRRSTREQGRVLRLCMQCAPA